MKKIIRLTESDLVRLVKKVILEQPNNGYSVVQNDKGKWRIFYQGKNDKTPTDAAEVFGQGPNWKDYNSESDARKAIEGLTTKTSSYKKTTQPIIPTKRPVMEFDSQRLHNNMIKTALQKSMSNFKYNDILRIFGGEEKLDSKLKELEPILLDKDYEPILDDEGNTIKINSIRLLKRYINSRK